MFTFGAAGARRSASAWLPVFFVLVGVAAAMPIRAENGPDALLAIDQHRASAVEHIVATWGAKVAQSSAMMSVDELRTALQGLRADQLLAASIAGSVDGLREVLGIPPASTPVSAKPASAQVKALGDLNRDVLYTPVTPCRLVETRGTFPAVYQGDGSVNHVAIPFASNEIRTYTVQGGNNVCLTQLPADLHASAVQLQVFGMPTTSKSGDIEILPQGATFGSTATMVYVGSIAFNTVSTAASVNSSNDQISVQVRGGGANLAIDVVGYFRPAGTATATEVDVNGQRVMRYEFNATSPNVIGGHPSNSAAAGAEGDVIAGGGFPASASCTIFGKSVPCNNLVSGTFNVVGGGSSNSAGGSESTISGGTGNITSGVFSTVAGGIGNTASGNSSIVVGGGDNVASGSNAFAAGHDVLADISDCAVFGFFTANGVANCKGVGNIIRLMANHGFSVDWGPATGNGGGTWWVEINDITPCRPINTYTNAFLSCSGVWTNNSDRNKKENFVPVDARAVLAELVTLPITQWNYKVEPGVLRMGPVAQDFHAVFGLGADDLTITPIDEAGVSFAAIQGLYQVMQEKDVAIQAQQRQIETQQRELGNLHNEIAELRATVAAILRNASLAAASNAN